MRDSTPSATAALVLQAVLFAAHDRNHPGLVSAEATLLSEAMARRVLPNPRLFSIAARNPLLRGLLKRVERLLNPGFVLHVAARKAMIEKLVRESVSKGSTQLIVIGAGYDTLALRMAASCPSLTCFELDHPATQALKRDAISSEHTPTTLRDSVPSERILTNLSFIPVDLATRPLREVLLSHPRFDPRANSVVVIEGVLMYLPEEAVRKLFQEMASLFGRGVTCVFTFMNRSANGSIEFQTAHPLVRAWLRRKSEQFLWGIERERLEGFLGAVEFRRVDSWGSAELRAEFRDAVRDARLAEGELVAEAHSLPEFGPPPPHASVPQ